LNKSYLGVVSATIGLMYFSHSSSKFHRYWLYLIPLVQVLDHLFFFVIGIGGLLAVRDDDAGNVIRWFLYASFETKVIPGVVVEKPLATFDERLAVVVVGSVLHGGWAAACLFLWAIIHEHGKAVDRIRKKTKAREKLHAQVSARRHEVDADVEADAKWKSGRSLADIDLVIRRK